MSTMTAVTEEGIGLHSTIRVRRWPSERWLFGVCVAVSLVLWLVLAVSIIGLLYGLFIAAFFFVMHLVLVAHVRGSSIRIGPEQFPELHERISGDRAEDRHEEGTGGLLDAGVGTLNAFATRFARSTIIVLYSDLLEACGDSTAARDMIIGHELGHIHAGHLRWHWITLLLR